MILPKTQMPLKPKVQRLLMRAGMYHRARTTFACELYWRLADPKVIDVRAKEVGFYRTLLKGFKNGDLIFDIGANHGTKTDIFLRLGARVIAVEPDESNQQALREAFLKYRMSPKPVTVVGKAVSDKVATEILWIDQPGSAKNTLNPKWVETLRNDGARFGQPLQFGEGKQVQTTTLDELIQTYGRPFFVKIDVEGYELSVLRGLQCAVPYLSFEVNLPEFRQEGLQCIELLHRLARDGRFNYTVDCQEGLALDGWVDSEGISAVLSGCAEKSIEVLWTSTPK